jgi:hypothetical protein
MAVTLPSKLPLGASDLDESDVCVACADVTAPADRDADSDRGVADTDGAARRLLAADSAGDGDKDFARSAEDASDADGPSADLPRDDAGADSSADEDKWELRMADDDSDSDDDGVVVAVVVADSVEDVSDGWCRGLAAAAESSVEAVATGRLADDARSKDRGCKDAVDAETVDEDAEVSVVDVSDPRVRGAAARRAEDDLTDESTGACGRDVDADVDADVDVITSGDAGIDTAGEDGMIARAINTSAVDTDRRARGCCVRVREYDTEWRRSSRVAAVLRM